jgi:hypothetical protein
MTTILAGLPWRVHSPSLFELDLACQCWLAYDGRAWRVAVDGAYGTRTFPSRKAAAQLVAYHFELATQQGKQL